jgi:thiamine-phosphate pyrophosphorylase
MASFDPALCLVTDADACGTRGVDTVVAAALRGGVTMVQLRDKHLSDTEFVTLAKRLKALTRPAGVPLILNDRVALVAAAGADGVHIGQSDMPYADARLMLGPGAIIGLSVETVAQVTASEEWDVDYLGVSPVFVTPTKTDAAPPWGLTRLPELRRRSRHILIGIGGINSANAEAVIRAGLDGIAVVTAICAAADPAAAAAALREAVRRGRG